MLSRRAGEAHEHAGAGLGRARTCCCTRCRTPCATRRPVSTAPHRRLLPESRLAPADEPPAEEPNQSTNNSYHGHRDARYGTRGKVGITIASSAIPHEQQRTASAAGGSQLLAYISTHLCAGSASSTAGQEMHPGAPKTLGCLPRRYVCIHMHKHMEQQLGRDRSAGSVARRHSALRGVHRGHRAAPHCVEARDQVALGAQDTDRTLSKDQLSQGCVSGDS